MHTAFRALTGVVLLLSVSAWPRAAAPRQDSTLFYFTGKVRDAHTGEAIAYAAVGIPGTPVGTVSDTAGRFSLRVPVKYSGDTLLVSLLGYAPYWALIGTLPLLEAAVRLYNTHNRPFAGIQISRLVAVAQIRSSREAAQYAFPNYNALYTLL
jgi:hypothetical protein